MTSQGNCDPRIRAAEKLLDALAECERECGDFGCQSMIRSTKLGAVMLLLGGKTRQATDGSTYVEIIHDGAELMVEV